MGLSPAKVHRIMQQRNWCPYKIQIAQTLDDEDIDRRLEFAENQLEGMKNALKLVTASLNKIVNVLST